MHWRQIGISLIVKLLLLTDVLLCLLGAGEWNAPPSGRPSCRVSSQPICWKLEIFRQENMKLLKLHQVENIWIKMLVWSFRSGGAFFGQRRACLGCSSEDFEMAESKILPKNPHSADRHLPHWLIRPVIPVLSCAINDSGANGGNGGKWRTFANGKKRWAIICGGIQVSSWGNFTTKCKHTAPVVAKPNEESKMRT